MFGGSARDVLGDVLDPAEVVGARGAPGPGVLQGLGSAAPSTEESHLDDVHTTFVGRALAVIRPTGPGTVTVTVSASGCDTVTVTVELR
jgi:hypothetical protein